MCIIIIILMRNQTRKALREANLCTAHSFLLIPMFWSNFYFQLYGQVGQVVTGIRDNSRLIKAESEQDGALMTLTGPLPLVVTRWPGKMKESTIQGWLEGNHGTRALVPEDTPLVFGWMAGWISWEDPAVRWMAGWWYLDRSVIRCMVGWLSFDRMAIRRMAGCSSPERPAVRWTTGSMSSDSMAKRLTARCSFHDDQAYGRVAVPWQDGEKMRALGPRGEVQAQEAQMRNCGCWQNKTIAGVQIENDGKPTESRQLILPPFKQACCNCTVVLLKQWPCLYLVWDQCSAPCS